MKNEKFKQLKLLSNAVKSVRGVELDPKTFLGQLKLRRVARNLTQNPETEDTLKILEHMDDFDLDHEPPLNIIPGVEVAIRTDIHIPNNLNYFMSGHSYVKTGQEPSP